jgi:hypothetical protein
VILFLFMVGKKSDKPIKSSRFQFRAFPETIELLNKLSEMNDRSPSNMLEVLIKEAAKKEGIIK